VEKQLVAIGYSSICASVFAWKVAKTEAKVALQIIAESKAVYRAFAKGQSSFLFLSSLSSLRRYFRRLEKLIISL